MSAVASHFPYVVGKDALMRYYISCNNAPCVKTLIDSGFDLNAIDVIGTTPLHIAAVHGNIDIMGMLVSHGARPDAVDACGRSPLDVALFLEQPVSSAWLREICSLADAVDGMLMLASSSVSSVLSHKLV
jgi:ankyrin repeat protein